MKQINVMAGDSLNLKAFGPATITKIYMHKETRELVANVRTESGEVLHLSLSYCEKVKV